MDDNSSDFKKILKGNLYILIASLFFGVDLPVVKYLIPNWMSSFDVTIFRMVGGCLLFWCASLFVKTQKIDKADYPRILLGGGISMFAFIFMLNLALKYTSPIDVAIISTLPPVFVIVIRFFFMHLKPITLEVLGVIISFVGAAIVILGQGASGEHVNGVLGDFIAIVSSICYAIYLVVMDSAAHKYKPISLNRWIFLGASVPCLFICGDFVKAPIFHHFEIEPILWIIFVVICVTFLSYLLVSPAVKLIGSEMTSLYQYVVPVFAAITSVIMGVSKLHFIQVVAMIVIIVGMIMTNKANKKKRKMAEAAAASTTAQAQQADPKAPSETIPVATQAQNSLESFLESSPNPSVSKSAD